MQRLDLVELRVDEGRHFRLLPGLGRPDRIAGHTDDAVLLAEQI